MESYNLDIAAIIILVAVALFGVHVVWALDHSSGTALQRGGACLVLSGAVLAGFPYISSKAIQIEAGRRLPNAGPFAAKSDVGKNKKRELILRPEAVRAVKIERYVAFTFILAGTLLNGYGDLWMGVRF